MGAAGFKASPLLLAETAALCQVFTDTRRILAPHVAIVKLFFRRHCQFFQHWIEKSAGWQRAIVRLMAARSALL